MWGTKGAQIPKFGRLEDNKMLIIHPILMVFFGFFN
jgi:hypothetical protein